MGNLRDICVQVKYKGNAKSLSEKFYEPVAETSVSHRAIVNGTDANWLLPVAITLLGQGGRALNTQIVIHVPPSFAENSIAETAAASSDIQNNLAQKLDAISARLAIEDSDAGEPGGSFNVKICVRNGESEPQVATEGFFTDEHGNSVAYEADWESGQGERELLIGLGVTQN
jgi:hypothetical protein